MEKELYLRSINTRYEVFLKDLSDKTIPYHMEFPFKEAAVIIVYPDGLIDAIRVTGKYSNHIDYYRDLFKTSEYFATEVRKRIKYFDILKETITNAFDNLLAKDGIAVFHNLDMEYLVEYGMDESENAEFFSYLPNEDIRTSEVRKTIDTIINNYDNNKIQINVYDPNFGRCKGREKENKR